MLVPSRARELIEAGAKTALADLEAVPPYDPGKPCEIKVEYKWTQPPSKLRFRSGVELLDSRTLVSRADDWWTAWKQFFFCPACLHRIRQARALRLVLDRAFD